MELLSQEEHDHDYRIFTTIQFLYLNRKVSLLSDNPELRTAISFLRKKYREGSPLVRRRIDHLISQKPRSVNLDPLRIETFLFGGLQGDYGSLSKKESLLYFHSINCLSSESVQYWSYHQGKLIKLNRSQSEVGYLFVPLDFTYLSYSDYHQLKSASLVRGGIYRTIHGKHWGYDLRTKDYTTEEVNNILLEDFPVNRSDLGVLSNHPPEKLIEIEDNKTLLILGGIGILVIIIVLFGWLMRDSFTSSRSGRAR